MANNYLLFSEVLPCANQEQQDWLMERFLLAEESEADAEVDYGIDAPECGAPCQAERHDDPLGVWLYTEESGELNVLDHIIRAFQRRFATTEPFILTYALTCSRPRLSEFDGGAIVFLRGESSSINASTWAYERVKDLERGYQ